MISPEALPHTREIPQTTSFASNLFSKLMVGLVYALLVAWSSVSVIGLGWMIMSSLKTNQELFANVWALPQAPQWINYENAWVNSNLSRFFVNSVLVTLAGIVITALLASMASYVIARYQFPGSRFFLVYFLSGFAIPIQLTIVPLFLALSRAGLINNLFVLAALYVAGALSFSIFTMIGFFRSLPKELEEAAILDGANDYQVFWQVMLPLARPGLVTITIFNFLYIWNEYFTAVLLINDSDKMTVSVGLYFLKATQGYAANWVGMLAGLIIVLIPNIIFFLIFQRQIAGGLTVGALKG